MNKNKILGLLTISGAALGVLAGCGGGDQPTNANEENVITFWHTFSKQIQQIVTRKADAFEDYIFERDGVRIEIKQDSQGDYDALKDKIIKGYAVGATPTITVAYPDNVAYYFGLESEPGEFVVRLDEFFEDEKLGFAADKTLNPNGLGTDDIVDSFFDEGQHYKYEGTYSLPFMKSSEIMLYNANVVEQLLADLGIQVGYERYMENITWDQLMNLCEVIRDNPAKYGLQTNGGKGYPLFYDSDANFFITQSYQRNIPYISMDESGKGSIDFANSEAAALINEFKELHDEKILTTKGVENQYGSDFFKSMQCIFTVGSTGGSGYSDPGVSFDVGVCKFPVYEGVSEERAKYVSQGVTLALLNNKGDSAEVNDKKVKYGWEFMKYLLNTENNVDICLASQGYIPVRNSCYEDEVFSEYLLGEDYMAKVYDAIVNDISGNYYNFPVFEGSDKARTEIESAVKNTLLGNGTAESNLEIAKNEALKDVK